MVTWVATNPWENRKKKRLISGFLELQKWIKMEFVFFFGGGNLEDDVPMISNVLIAPENG